VVVEQTIIATQSHLKESQLVMPHKYTLQINIRFPHKTTI